MLQLSRHQLPLYERIVRDRRPQVGVLRFSFPVKAGSDDDRHRRLLQMKIGMTEVPSGNSIARESSFIAHSKLSGRRPSMNKLS